MRLIIISSIFYVLFIITFVFFTGCNETCQEDAVFPEIPQKNVSGNIEHIYKASVCGGVFIRKPLFPIEGVVTGHPQGNATIYLYLAPRTDLESALEIVENCMSIGKRQINSTGGFRFEPVPVGSYILRVSASQFKGVRGFPIINEYNESNHSVEIIFHGGNYRHSLSAFSIIPRTGEG